MRTRFGRGLSGLSLWTAAALLGTVALSAPAAAHVDYVTNDDNPAVTVVEFLSTALSSPTSVALLVAGGVGAALAVVGYLTFSDLTPDIEVARRTLRSYAPYLPWMLRLALGLPLVGAGFNGYLFSPIIAVEARLLQIGIGFLLLFGMATRAVAALGLAAYVVTLLQFPAAVHASEYVAGFLAIVILGPGQPSADMLLRRLRSTEGTLTNRLLGGVDLDWARVDAGQPVAAVALRLFVGINFAFLGVSEKLLQPGRALAVVEKYDLTSVVPVAPELWVLGAALTEFAVGAAFIAGFLSRGVAAVAFVTLTMTLFGLPDDPVLAHVSLFGLTSAIMVVGSGPYSLDELVVPRLRGWLDARLRPARSDTAESAP